MAKYQNPVIKGFNPDPSICRVGSDFYLVTSTFEFFPGVPIYHSKNLVEWELINHCLTSDGQLWLKDCPCSGGIFAPTIRYHDGIFYMITTNISDKGNFIVHTKNIYGQWSKPQWIPHRGIDPSLLFDEDGKVYFCGTHFTEKGQGIALFEINPLTGERLSPTVTISYGAGGKHPEAPHLYKINGYYYLMLAEGGTEYGHMETIFRGKNLYGPYEACPYNPILSHKDFMGAPIQATGHADIVDDGKGNWWLVCLGIRPLGRMLLHNLGRETFLAPVVWEANGWPIVGNKGTIELEMEGNLPSPIDNHKQTVGFLDTFDDSALKLDWNFVRNTDRRKFDLRRRRGYLEIYAGEETLSDNEPAFIGVRQKEFAVTACTKVLLDLNQDGQMAGLTAFYNKNYHYEIYITRENGANYVVLAKTVHDMECIAKKVAIRYRGEIEFKLETGIEDYLFSYRSENGWVALGSGKTVGLCTEGTMTMTFTGTYLGIFARSAKAYFDYFSIQPVGCQHRE